MYQTPSQRRRKVKCTALNRYTVFNLDKKRDLNNWRKTICDMEPQLFLFFLNIFCLGACILPSCFLFKKFLLKMSLSPRPETSRHPLFMINH